MEKTAKKNPARMATAALLLLVGAVCIAGGTRGCGEAEARDGRHPLVRRAIAAREAEKPEEAIGLLEKALRRHPENIAAHRELALLLDHYKGDAPGAIVHYRRYLELNPEGRQRAEVEEMLEHCQTAYAAAFVKGSGDLKRELTRRDDRIRELELQVARLRETVQPEPGTSIRVPASAARAMEAAASRKPAARVHVVGAGETLSAISERYYGTVSRWSDILQANRDQLPAANRLKPGMELTIPE